MYKSIEPKLVVKIDIQPYKSKKTGQVMDIGNIIFLDPDVRGGVVTLGVGTALVEKLVAAKNAKDFSNKNCYLAINFNTYMGITRVSVEDITLVK